MGVPLQLILVILLTLVQCSTASVPNLRQIREAPPPTPAPIQNVTEINNRDLNKIVNDDFKTETVDSRKIVNNVHNYEELPLKLAKIKDERQINPKTDRSEEAEDSKEDFKKGTVKLAKDKHREDSSRAIDVDSSKYWSDDFHSKNVFTLPPSPDIESFPNPSDVSVEGTWYPLFEVNADLTTPTTKVFDQKFKETFESVEQNIEDNGHEHEHEHTDNEDDDDDEQDKDTDLSVQDPVKKSENDSLDIVKTKAIVNNDTVDKNSIHKDVNLEQTKTLRYESIFNDTKVYGGETTKKNETSGSSSTESTTTVKASIVSVNATRKSSMLKDNEHEHEHTDNDDEQDKDADLSVQEPVKISKNDSADIVKTKAIVHNETVDNNSIHKDVNLEQTKTLRYESIFNDTKVYGGETTTKDETPGPSSTENTTSMASSVSATTTRKNSLLKEELTEKSNTHILSNNIETELTKPIKGVSTTTTFSTTERNEGELQDIIITAPATSSEVPSTESQNTSTSARVITRSTTDYITLTKTSKSDKENHVIPHNFSSESAHVQDSSSASPPTLENSTHLNRENTNQQNHTVESRLAMDKVAVSTTTEIPTSTDAPETTTFDFTIIPSGDMIYSVNEGTTVFVIENTTEISDPTTELPSSTEEASTVALDTSTTENVYRTSKRLEKSIVTEQMVKVNEISSESNLKLVDASSEIHSGNIDATIIKGTSVFVIENTAKISDPTTELPSSTEEASTGALDTSTTENVYRTSKRLEKSIVTEQMVNVNEISSESNTKLVDASTESTVRNKLHSTTLDDGSDVEPKASNNIVKKLNDPEESTTEEMVPSSTVSYIEITTFQSTTTPGNMQVNVTTEKIAELSEATTEVKTTLNSTEKVIETPPTTTEIKPTSRTEKIQPTTTEYVFIHIENAGTNHTVLLPEVLSPNFDYSTTTANDNETNKIRKVILDESSTSLTEHFNSSTTTSTTTSKTTSSTTPESRANVSSTTEDGTETPTDNSYSKDDSGGNQGKIAAIAISSVGAVCLVLLAGLLYVMKKRQKRLNYGPRCRPVSLDDYSIDNLSVYNSVRRKGGARLSKRSFGNPAFEDPVAPTHPLNFPALAKFATNHEDIKAEFEEIPQISARTSELPDGCETKNRYANVIPLPETRVFLKPIDGYPNSDYINANYVTGPKNVKGYYIAAQGPMQNTVGDFWRMIWEQQAKVILMLTHLVENGLEKCVDYLPESEVIDCSRSFGDFQIVLKKQEVKDKYIISTLQLKNMVSNSWREVTHFWYLGWPEKGVPAEGNSLIAFLIEARSYMKTASIDKRDGVNGIQNGGAQNEHNPVVVHCSPGTGRTGVAMACDIAIREFETARLVDIPKIVYRIRRDRAAAVQTKEQYMFIYKVVSLYATKLTGEALENC